MSKPTTVLAQLLLNDRTVKWVETEQVVRLIVIDNMLRGAGDSVRGLGRRKCTNNIQRKLLSNFLTESFFFHTNCSNIKLVIRMSRPYHNSSFP